MMNKPLITLKNNLPAVTVLQINGTDINAIKTTLRDKIKQAPMMFVGMQIVIDISTLSTEANKALDVGALRKVITAEGINPIAIMSDKQSDWQRAIDANIGAIPVVQTQTEKRPRPQKNTTAQDNPEPQQPADDNSEPKKTFAENNDNAPITGGSKTVRQPVRSGQRIYAQGDLTVIGTVSPGAEVIADGNIHIYGTLKGRAIAGAKGDESAQVFCQNLDAELISIAGNYKQAEDISEEYRHRQVQISLDGEKIHFVPL